MKRESLPKASAEEFMIWEIEKKDRSLKVVKRRDDRL
jgi:hypothetical protein